MTTQVSGETRGPKRIWLNTAGDYSHFSGDEMETLLWSECEVDNGDEKYVRADLYADLRAKLDALVEAGEEVAEFIGAESEMEWAILDRHCTALRQAKEQSHDD